MKKFISLLLVLVVAMGVFTGCKKGSSAGNTDNDLEIYCMKKGYDVKWFEAAVELFEQQAWVQEKYPNLEVTVDIDESDATPIQKLSAGSNYNTIDLMFGNPNFNSSLGSKNGILMNLTESYYNSEVPGENVLVKDKMLESIRSNSVYGPDSMESDQYYSAPYVSGYSGILYNKTILDKLGIEVPLTTDQFLAACDQISNTNNADYDKGYAVMVNSNDGYWKNIYEVFWGQYSGAQALENFYNGIVGDIQSSDVFADIGRLKALEFYESLFKPYKSSTDFKYDSSKNTYKYIYPLANEASTDHIAVQGGFLSGYGVFHMNGNYFQTEMALYRDGYEQQGYVYDIQFMKTPVLSSIREVATSIADDNELAALIKAIDSGNTALTGTGYQVTQADYNKVKEARGIVQAGGMVAVIPEYASAKEAAVDFLRFLATDTVQEECYIKTSYGLTSPFKCDATMVERNSAYTSDVYLSAYKILNDVNVPALGVPHDSRFPYGVKSFHDLDLTTGSFERAFSVGQRSALDIYQNEIDYWEDNQRIWTEMFT